MAKKEKEKKEDKPQRMRIVYKDRWDKVKEATISLYDKDYFNGEDYKENVDRAISVIVEEGGFWLTATTAIPFHRILSFHTFADCESKSKIKVETEEKSKPQAKKTQGQRPKGRRGRIKRNEKPVQPKDTVPQDSGNAGGGD